MNAQRVHCPECGERVPVEHLALEAGWGKCVRCEVVYEKGAVKIHCDTQAERDWLIAAVNDYLQAHPFNPHLAPPTAYEPATVTRDPRDWRHPDRL